TTVPTVKSTGAPTLDYYDYMTFPEYSTYRQRVNSVFYSSSASRDNWTQNATFNTYNYKGLTVEGTCPSWKTFVNNQLTLPLNTLYFSAITGVFGYQPNVYQRNAYVD